MAEPTRRIETSLGFPKLLPLFPPPEKGTYPYFAGGDRFRFEPTTRQHSPTNAWWLAECSLLAYADQAEMLDLIKHSGLIAVGAH